MSDDDTIPEPQDDQAHQAAIGDPLHRNIEEMDDDEVDADDQEVEGGEDADEGTDSEDGG